MEQTYVNIPRRSGGRQAPRKTAGPHKNQRPRRSPFKRFLWGVYGLIVALSAVIVGVYIAFRVMVKPPDIAAPDPPVVVEILTRQLPPGTTPPRMPTKIR